MFEIAFYTIMQFGERQADIYKNQLLLEVKRIAQNPKIGKQRFDLRKELFSINSGIHIIFYEFDAEFLTVIRIIHGNRDLNKIF